MSGVISLDVASGKTNYFFTSKDDIISQMAWMPEGSSIGVLYADRSTTFQRSQIGILSFPDGQLRRVTNDLYNYAAVAVSADGNTLATVLRETRQDLSVLPAQDPSEARATQITSRRPVESFAFSADGDLLVASDFKIARYKTTGGEPEQLIADQHPSASPASCGGGKYIVFTGAFRTDDSSINLWRADTNGSNLKQLTTGKFDQNARCALISDNNWVYYSDRANGDVVMRIPLEGGQPERATSDGSLGRGSFDLSPDGKLLGVGALVAPLKFQYVVTDQSSHAVVARIDPPKGAVSALQFLNDLSFAVALRENGVDNLWVYPIAGGPGRQVTHFKSDYIFEFHFSPDAKNIALARGRTDSDIVLIRDVKQK